MTFNKEQLEALSKYEPHFKTAIEADWSRYPSKEGIDTIHSIFTETTGDKRAINYNCSSCILSLLKDCGRIYFADKAEAEKVLVKMPRQKKTRK